MTNGFSSPEIEQAAISAMMQWPNCRDKGLASLSQEHFYSSQNRHLFSTIKELAEDSKPVELISLTHQLREKHLLEAIGGAHYVTVTYASTCHSPAAFDYYVQILAEELERRMVLTTCAEVSKTDLSGEDSPVAHTIGRLEEIPRYNPKKEWSLSDAVAGKMERMERREQDKEIIKTGLEKLDYHSPLWLSDMPLISGERKAGKSILALTIALNVARAGIPVGYFSLEDSEHKVIDRLLAGVSRLPMARQDHVSTLSDEEIRKSAEAASTLGKLPIHVRDDVYDLPNIIASIRELKTAKQIGLVVVDYGQLVRTKVQKDRTREQEVAHVSRALRLLAMELELPLILLSQLNADGFTRESRALEQDATAMWKVSADEHEQNKRWIEIPWQRNGESNIRFPVTFHGYCARIENYVEDREEG